MYLHLGQNVIVAKDSIIGIFDLDNASWSHITRKFLNEAEKNGQLINISEELPKSFIICSECGKMDTYKTVYFSQLSSQTLYKRMEHSQI